MKIIEKIKNNSQNQQNQQYQQNIAAYQQSSTSNQQSLLQSSINMSKSPPLQKLQNEYPTVSNPPNNQKQYPS